MAHMTARQLCGLRLARLSGVRHAQGVSCRRFRGLRRAAGCRGARCDPFLKALGIAKAEDAVDLTVVQDGKQRIVHLTADPTQPDIWNALPKPAGWAWIGNAANADYRQDNDKPFWWKAERAR
jgi:hypothetical protein